MSKYIINSFQTPNAIIDDLMPLLTDSEFRVLMFMVREIIGWVSSAETKRANIAQSVMESGYSYTDKQGVEKQKLGCGVKKGAIKTALKALQTYRIIKAIGKPSNEGQLWELCLLTDSNPDIAGLKLRADTKARKAKKQTSKARKNNPKNTGGTVQQIPLQGDCSTDTQGDCSTDTQGDCSTDTNETQETQETNSIGATPTDPTPPKDDFKAVRDLVDGLGLLQNITDIEMFKSDFDEYTLDQWLSAIETFKERRKAKSAYLPYKYLASIAKGLADEVKQAEAMKPKTKTVIVLTEPIKSPMEDMMPVERKA